MIGLRGEASGDTIVEVLIAVSIVSMVLAVAYGAGNRNTQSLLDAQEHSQAQKLVESQIEFLRHDYQQAAASGALPYNFGSNVCFDSNGTKIDNSSNGCIVGPDGHPTANQPAYMLTVTPGDPYAVSATWTTLVGNGPSDGNVTMYFRPD